MTFYPKGPFGMFWRSRIFGRVIALKSPRWPVLFTERERRGVRVIPLGRGWGITIRRIAAHPPADERMTR